jgi:hypothetical protein
MGRAPTSPANVPVTAGPPRMRPRNPFTDTRGVIA